MGAAFKDCIHINDGVVRMSEETWNKHRAEITTLRKALAFQDNVGEWILACFGEAVAADKIERNHRFLEEALELVQAGGCTACECYRLVDYVYSRSIGELDQEVGGVMLTLAALCNAQETEMDSCGTEELARVWTKIEQIRAKQAAKPKHSPLPEDGGQRARAALKESQ